MPKIDCPTCERMGRVTVEREGRLTTTTCPNCNGWGELEDHDQTACERCAVA